MNYQTVGWLEDFSEFNPKIRFLRNLGDSMVTSSVERQNNSNPQLLEEVILRMSLQSYMSHRNGIILNIGQINQSTGLNLHP